MGLCILKNDGVPTYSIELAAEPEAVVFCNKVWVREDVVGGVAFYRKVETHVARQLSYIKPEKIKRMVRG